MAQRIVLKQWQWLSLQVNNVTSNLMRFSSQIPRLRRSSPFAVLQNVTISKNENFIKASKRMQADVQKYQDAMDICQKGGGEKAIARHKKQKKLLAMERLSLVLDEDSDFLELSPLAGLGMEYGDVPKAGLITGIGSVNGVLCMFIVNDATVKGGTVYPITLKKQLRAQEIAEQNRLPCVYVVDSGGAYLPLQAEIFPDKNQGGRVFYNEAVFSSVGIPQVAVVCGSCTAGAAYIPTLADEAIIINKIGRIFLGGPPLVKAATGEVVTADDLGGAILHSTISGCTDHYTDTEQEAFATCREVVASFNIPDTPTPQEWNAPLYDPKELIGLVPENIQDYDVHKILARVVDGSEFHEFKARYGLSLVTGFCHIEGHLVGVLANKGEITGEGALKGAHFVQLCSERRIPLLFLQNSAASSLNSDNSGEALGEVMKNHAKMLYAVSVAEVPKLTVIVGGSHGINNYLMAGRAMSPNFVFLWPSAHMCAADLCGETEHIKVTDDTNKSANEAEKMSALFSSSRLWDDGILLPEQTRQVLGQCLRVVSRNPQLPRRGAGVIRM